MRRPAAANRFAIKVQILLADPASRPQSGQDGQSIAASEFSCALRKCHSRGLVS